MQVISTVMDLSSGELSYNQIVMFKILSLEKKLYPTNKRDCLKLLYKLIRTIRKKITFKI